jgi:hypothetical protein
MRSSGWPKRSLSLWVAIMWGDESAEIKASESMWGAGILYKTQKSLERIETTIK